MTCRRKVVPDRCYNVHGEDRFHSWYNLVPCDVPIGESPVGSDVPCAVPVPRELVSV